MERAWLTPTQLPFPNGRLELLRLWAGGDPPADYPEARLWGACGLLTGAGKKALSPAAPARGFPAAPERAGARVEGGRPV